MGEHLMNIYNSPLGESCTHDLGCFLGCPLTKYADRKRSDVDEYKVGDLVMLSTKDLKYQMEKLMNLSVSSYKIKKIVSSNV